MVRPLFALVVVLAGCSNLVVVRGSSSDFLKRKATTVALGGQLAQVGPVIDELLRQRGFQPVGPPLSGEHDSQVVFYKGPRAVPPDMAASGIQLGSWFAARATPSAGPAGGVDVTLIGKPMIGNVELCSDHDNQLADVQYQCQDSKIPPDWAGRNLISGRDETEVVSWVLNLLYERLKR